MTQDEIEIPYNLKKWNLNLVVQKEITCKIILLVNFTKKFSLHKSFLGNRKRWNNSQNISQDDTI